MNQVQLVGPGIPIGVSDRILINGFTQTANLRLSVRIRTITPDGVTQLHEHTFVTTGEGFEDLYTIIPDSGILIGLEARIDGGSQTPIEGFFNITLSRLSGALPARQMLLAGGYVSNNNSIGWPGIPPVKTFEISGVPVTVTVANPPAGSNWSYAVPDGTEFAVKSIRFRLVTSATVATRRVRVEFISLTNLLHQVQFVNTQAASLTYDYNLAVSGASETLNDSIVNVPIPEIPLIEGTQIRSSVNNLQAGDQFSAIVIHGLRRARYL